MADTQKPVIRTVVTPQGYARAVITGWQHVGDGVPTKEQVGVLFSQWLVETGGSACWNWNFSNAKHVTGDGFDYMCLNGVWEGVTAVTAANLIAAGRAIYDPSPDHAKAVGPGKVSVIFPAPQPESRFRAYPDLTAGMLGHLRLLHDHFPAAWGGVMQGDPMRTALALGAHGYFTASATVYGAGMLGHFQRFMATSAYELALDDVQAVRDAETQPEGLPDPPSEPTAADEPTTIVHVDPSVYLGNEPPDESA